MDATTERRAHRLTGAVPLVVALALAIGVCALLSPWVRHQLAVSFSREPARYTELYFTDETAARECLGAGGQLAVAATVRSHLDGTRSIAYRVSVTGASSDSVGGTVRVGEGKAAAFVVPVRVPSSGAYTVQVVLPGRAERLVLHCPATTSGTSR